MRNSVRRLIIRGICTRLTSIRFVPSYTMSTLPKLTSITNEATLNFHATENEFKFTFRYVDTENNINRELNFCRKITETVDAFLKKLDSRIILETQKKLNKRARKNELCKRTTQTLVSESTNVEENKIALYNGDIRVDNTYTWGHILGNEMDLKLVIFEKIYVIKVNVPLIKNLKLSPLIMVGFPTYPLKLEIQHTAKELIKFTWYKHSLGSKDCQTWQNIGNGYMYTPQAEDVGCKLKLICEPRNERFHGPTIDVMAPNPVSNGPTNCPFENRHALTTTKLSGDRFRITSYNILAGVYSDTDYSRGVLFNYCPNYALSMVYRKQLILKELIGYNSDIMCLQEVDESIFENDLLPILSTKGYNGRYAMKSKQKEGLATFYNENRFYVAASDTAVIKDNVKLENFSDIWEQITNTKIKNRFLGINTIIQINALVPKETPNIILLVANTHLYFHPDADHIRLLQGYYVLEYLAQFSRKLKQECPLSRIDIILCGDFNTTPDSGLYKLITTNVAPKDLPDWKSNVEEGVENISLSHKLNLASACGTPQYTNYTPNFSGCLDYIFYDTDNFQVEKIIDMPSVEEISRNEGLPSPVFPSDHIALCAEMKWET